MAFDPTERGTHRRHLALKGLAAAAVVLALLVVLAVELADTQHKSREDVRDRVHERSALAAALIDSLFESPRQQIPTWSASYGGATVDAKALQKARGQSVYLMVLDARGEVLAETDGVTDAVRADLARSPLLRRPAGPYAIGDIVPYGRTGAIAYAVPFPTPYGTRTYVTGFTPANLYALIAGELRRIPGVGGARSYLLDGARTVVASTDPARKVGFRFDRPDLAAALSRPSGTQDGRYYDQAAIAGSRWHLVLAAPSDDLFATVSGLRRWVPWLIFAGFVVVLGVAFALGRRALLAGDALREANGRLASVNAELAASNAALERRASELGRSNDELEQFASIASHDLQEPLRKVRTFTQQLEVMEAERLSEKGQDYLRRTNAAAERMQRLIEDLLRFSRVATQARPFARVDLGEVTRQVLGDLELEIERADASVHVGSLPQLNGDATQLRQLMQNLVSNALKFRREDVAPEVWVAAATTGEAMVLTVRDNGIGFDPRYEQRIFRVFERLHGRTEYPGTGIGLALCRKIVERHGGQIEAHGQDGAGATFTVRLPLALEQEVLPAPPTPLVHA